ncbi:MAG: hypothetical protein ACODAD_03845, partial [Planctomycetota bacterium]
HVFPCYSDHRYCTGPLVPRPDCPPEYAGPMMDDEMMMPMQEMPRKMGKPTPANTPAPKQAPSRIIPLEEQSHNLRRPQETRPSRPTHAPVTSSRQAQTRRSGGRPTSDAPPQSNLSKFISWEGKAEGKLQARAESSDTTSGPETSQSTSNPLRQ